VDSFVDAPVAVGVLSGGLVGAGAVTAPKTTLFDAGRLWRTAPPTLASVDSERSRSIAATLVLNAPLATPTRETPVRTRASFDAPSATRVGGSVLPTGGLPPSAIAHAPGAAVARAGGEAKERLAGFDAALQAKRRTAAGNPGATLQPGEVAVLRMPNARHDVGDAQRPQLGVTGAPARLVVVAHGGRVLADRVIGISDRAETATLALPPGTERVIAIGIGAVAEFGAGLDGWHAGSNLPYFGWSSAVGRGCTVRSRGEPIFDHRERLEAGWVTGAELARGLSTVTTRFRPDVRTVLVAVDDPTAFGGDIAGRGLVLGLDGATRVTDGSGRERPPVLLTSENRSVLAYDVEPLGDPIPVRVTIATEQGWSLVGVMGSADLGAEAAIALVSSRGLDAALRPLAQGTTGTSRLEWLGERRARGSRTSQSSKSSKSSKSSGASRSGSRTSGGSTSERRAVK
jgi:hypothetical protein